jgi:hypothetical protein
VGLRVNSNALLLAVIRLGKNFAKFVRVEADLDSDIIDPTGRPLAIGKPWLLP